MIDGAHPASKGRNTRRIGEIQLFGLCSLRQSCKRGIEPLSRPCCDQELGPDCCGPLCGRKTDATAPADDQNGLACQMIHGYIRFTAANAQLRPLPRTSAWLIQTMA